MTDNNQSNDPNKISANRDLIIGGSGGTILALAIGAFPWLNSDVKTFLLVFAPSVTSLLTWQWKILRYRQKQKNNKIVLDDAIQTAEDALSHNRGLTPEEKEEFRSKIVGYQRQKLKDLEDRIDLGEDIK